MPAGAGRRGARKVALSVEENVPLRLIAENLYLSHESIRDLLELADKMTG